MSVFMERNAGLFALLSIATVAAWFAPPVQVLGLSLLPLTLLLWAGFIAANVVIANRHAYRMVDYLIALTPLARLRSRATSLYDALVPYRTARGVVSASIGLSFVFQATVILVVFLNANALAQHVPVSALAVFVVDRWRHAACQRERPGHPRGAYCCCSGASAFRPTWRCRWRLVFRRHPGSQPAGCVYQFRVASALFTH